MTKHGWHDSLLWSIRPDCAIEAQKIVERIAAHSGAVVTPDAAGLHRENLWKSITKSYARWFDMDELPIDMIGDSIAVVSVSGPLVNLVNPWTANYPALNQSFELIRDNNAIKACMVLFNTPGGTVSGLKECADILDSLAETKLTIAQNNGGCYSAGYYLASRCGTICSGETDQIGNIGTVSTLYDYSKYFEENGIRTIVKRTGPIKGLGIPGDPVTDMQEQFLEHLTQAHFAYFRDAVTGGRNLSEEEFATVSDGRWWLGSEAIGLKLIDLISTHKETISLLKQQVG
jgi:signal peptide peptidase SppA